MHLPEYYYTESNSVAAALKQRQGLRQDVEQYWREKGWGAPNLPSLAGTLPGLLARQLLSFRLEDGAFVLMCEQAGIIPVWGSWVEDRFASHSPLKRSYLRPRIITRDKYKRVITRGIPTLTGKGWDGVPLNEIELERIGLSLVSYHRKIHEIHHPSAISFDISSWFRAIERKEDRYDAFISMSVAHFALFDDYHGGETAEGQTSLTEGRFEPSFHRMEKIFGVKPLVVLLPWQETYSYYPQALDWRDVVHLPQAVQLAVSV